MPGVHLPRPSEDHSGTGAVRSPFSHTVTLKANTLLTTTKPNRKSRLLPTPDQPHSRKWFHCLLSGRLGQPRLRPAGHTWPLPAQACAPPVPSPPRPERAGPRRPVPWPDAAVRFLGCQDNYRITHFGLKKHVGRFLIHFRSTDKTLKQNNEKS